MDTQRTNTGTRKLIIGDLIILCGMSTIHNIAIRGKWGKKKLQNTNTKEKVKKDEEKTLLVH